MDYKEYDRIQADLGGVGDALRFEIENVLGQSSADIESKDLVNKVCELITRSFDEVALLISQSLQAAAK